jgi:signal transduction histidine kinase
MKFFTAPGRFLMNRLSYLLKFLVIGIVLLIPGNVVFSQYMTNIETQRVALERELVGLEYFVPLSALLRDLRIHRDLSSSRLAGFKGFDELYEEVEERIEANLKATHDINAKHAATLGLGDAWSEVEEAWEELEETHESMTPLENFDANTVMVDEAYDFRVEVANAAGLILDRDITSYYMADLVTNDLAELAESTARARGLGTLLISSQSLDEATLSELRSLEALVDIRLDSITEFFAYLSDTSPRYKQLVDDKFGAYLEELPAYFERIEETFISSATSVRLTYVKTANAVAFFDQTSEAVDHLYEVETTTIPLLRDGLNARHDTLVNQRNGYLAITVIALIVAIYLLYTFYQTVADMIKRLDEAAKRLAAGEPSPEVVLETRDELGKVATSFNTIGNALVKSNQELSKRARELEVANALAREASRVKSHFLSTMSHELRTPMNAIVGFTDLILTEKPGPLTTMQRTFLERTSGNNRRLLTLINDVLDLSRIEAGRMEIVPKPYIVREMIERITAQTSSLFSQKGLQFETQVDAELPETVVGDQGRVEQVIVNLLSNAAKFTTEGTVRMKVSASGLDRWSIEVTDTGKGISPHMQEVIFEPFRQVEGGTTREIGGSGLGLAISRELVQMMDGTLNVRSEIGKGSTFTVNLPLTSAHPAAHTDIATNVA